MKNITKLTVLSIACATFSTSIATTGNLLLIPGAATLSCAALTRYCLGKYRTMQAAEGTENYESARNSFLVWRSVLVLAYSGTIVSWYLHLKKPTEPVQVSIHQRPATQGSTIITTATTADGPFLRPELQAELGMGTLDLNEQSAAALQNAPNDSALANNSLACSTYDQFQRKMKREASLLPLHRQFGTQGIQALNQLPQVTNIKEAMVNIKGNILLLCILRKVAVVTKEHLECHYSKHESFSDILLYSKPDNFWIARVNEQAKPQSSGTGANITKYYLVGEFGADALERDQPGHGIYFRLNDPEKLKSDDRDFWMLTNLLQLPIVE